MGAGDRQFFSQKAVRIKKFRRRRVPDFAALRKKIGPAPGFSERQLTVSTSGPSARVTGFMEYPGRLTPV
jgi:hypothetical protein